jgi:endopeptidase La
MGITERNQHMKIINDLTKQLNSIYNESISKLCDDDNSEYIKDEYDVDLSNIIPLMNNGINYFDEIRNIISMWKKIGANGITSDPKTIKSIEILHDDPLSVIRKQLQVIGGTIGFYSISDAVQIIYCETIDKFFKNLQYNEIKLFDSLFVPLKYESIIVSNDIKNLTCRKAVPDHDVLLDNCSEIIIKDMNDKDNAIILKGYFEVDCLNIVLRTSQICHSFVHDKRKLLEEAVDEKIKYLNDKFKRIYIKNLTFSDIISYDEKSFIKKIEDDYAYYGKLIKMLSFRNLMNEFTKDCPNSLSNMFTIIKLLLLGTDDCVNFAGLLYGLTKDKKVSGELISDVIYRNLCYSSQIKLKKTVVSIKTEMDKLKALTPDDVDMKKQLSLCKNMPLSVKKCVLEKIDEMKSGTSEYHKQSTYVKMMMAYPWPSDNDDIQFVDIGKDISKSKEYLDHSKKVLDDTVFGHDGCKDAIQEMIAKWLSNPKSSGKAIGLYGPPGVGKTLIAKGLGKALNIPFVQINLGGQDDGNVLCGHSYTYSAAQPGLIVKKMIEASNARCIMYFDELDKACKKHDTNEIYNILIHLTDPNTNCAFNDRYFSEIDLPLNKVLFVFSYNSPELIDKILRDRLHEIEVKSYTLSNKLVICKKFLMKEICDGIGLDKNIFDIDDTVFEYIVENYTHESGVRELKRKIESLFLKLNIDRYYGKGPFTKSYDSVNKISITMDVVNEYLKKPKLNIREIPQVNCVGIVNGLYATTTGQGGIITIMLNKNFTGSDGKFALRMTGSQKRVMKESVEYSYCTAMKMVQSEFKKLFLENYSNGVLVHTPEAATPKDGPSAGSAFTVAFLSCILNKKINRLYALTGEIEPTGDITEIGGLPYKLAGAKKAGVKFALVPRKNESDLKELQENSNKLFTDGFEAILVDTIKDVAKHMLLEDDGSQIDISKYLIV